MYDVGRKILRPKAKAPTPALRDELHYEIKQEVKASQLTLAEERKEQALAAKERAKWSLGELSDEEMVAYAMMISQEEEPHTDDPTTGEKDYDEDEAILQAVMASLQMTANDDTPPTDSPPSNDGSAAHPMDSDLEWPMIGSSTPTPIATPTTQQHDGWDDDDDEELQYVLQLSRNQM